MPEEEPKKREVARRPASVSRPLGILGIVDLPFKIVEGLGVDMGGLLEGVTSEDLLKAQKDPAYKEELRKRLQEKVVTGGGIKFGGLLGDLMASVGAENLEELKKKYGDKVVVDYGVKGRFLGVPFEAGARPSEFARKVEEIKPVVARRPEAAEAPKEVTAPPAEEKKGPAIETYEADGEFRAVVDNVPAEFTLPERIEGGKLTVTGPGSYRAEVAIEHGVLEKITGDVRLVSYSNGVLTVALPKKAAEGAKKGE